MAEPREQLRDALSSFLTPEQLTKLVDEVLAITKRANVETHCKWCKKSQMSWIQVPDAKAVASALPDLLNQAYGRPGEEAHQGEPIVFIRVSTMAEAEKIIGSKPDPKPTASKAKPGRPRKTVGRQKQTPVGGV